MTSPDPLRARLRAGTLFIILGLFLSGATAVPLPSELALAEALLGPDMSAGRRLPGWWRVIDSAFGVIGFLPMWLCDRWARALERLRA